MFTSSGISGAIGVILFRADLSEQKNIERQQTLELIDRIQDDNQRSKLLGEFLKTAGKPTA